MFKPAMHIMYQTDPQASATNDNIADLAFVIIYCKICKNKQKF